jgi:hypothetical protein
MSDSDSCQELHGSDQDTHYAGMEAMKKLKLAKNAMISGNGLPHKGEQKAQCCFT